MDKIDETQLPTDLLAGLLMAQAPVVATKPRERQKLTARIYAVMAVTTALTFATLTTGYQLLFTNQLFA